MALERSTKAQKISNCEAMTDRIKKFLDALDAPDDPPSSKGNVGWPAAIPRVASVADYPVHHQFLADEAIGSYLTELQKADITPRQARRTPVPKRRQQPVPFAVPDRHWTVEQPPLALCEFLAYKAGLSYRTPRQIRRDLLGQSPNGRRYNPGVTQYAFFDTSHPRSTVRYGDTQAFAFVHHRTGYIVFRGTSSFADIATDFYDELTETTYATLETVPQTLVGRRAPARHTGFAIAWGSIAPDVEAWANDQLRHGRMDNVVFSGHSLGGALAMLAGFQFATKRICPVHAVITFGAPMVGGEAFKSQYESAALGLKDRTLRMEAAEDLVAVLTKRANDYCHVGHAWRFNKRPLRPTWQMLLFSPLMDIEEATARRIERNQRKLADKKPLASKSARPSRSNSAAAAAPRTWLQFCLGLVLQLVWYLARLLVRSVAAHSVESRYGLFLSTLSYRRIRSYRLEEAHLKLLTHRGQESERIVIEDAYRAAGLDLKRHLAVVRGRHPRTFKHLHGRPIRIATPTDLAYYQRKYKSYIA